ncbi:YihY/virulence factor BrkB family protein [Pengzhenrongella sicca]|uniref:YihY/virulence factor BrkB family protein n=1 Tax=Pengzhenrongella sicca TaxID=2819238 RepID=A0A8A4ZAC4_9MICO|nr:YihY/virulence factor BrkB family protein [Pengzhenrongella sicca]QTE28804.1 YihY/virulence factor BrkB family protein [Pengzhenrongella sicca]
MGETHRPEHVDDAVASPAAGAGSAHVAAASTADVAAGRPETGPRGFAAIVARLQAVLAWWQQTRPARANARFGAAGGGVLTGGIAYSALFSVFAGLTLGYTVFMAVLGRNTGLRQDVLDTLASSLPGLIDTGDDSGLLKPEDLVVSAGLNAAGVVAVVVLALSATAAMAALRTAIRAMFGAQGGGGNAVTGKLRELASFAGLALAVLLSAVLSIVVTTAAGWALDLVGLSDGMGFVVRVVGIAVAFVVDVGIFVLVVVVLAGQHPHRRELRGGAIIAAVGIGAVRLLGTSVVARSSDANALLASFAVLVTLLIWINLIARIVLLAAAWTANPPLPTPVEEPLADPDAAASPAA